MHAVRACRVCRRATQVNGQLQQSTWGDALAAVAAATQGLGPNEFKAIAGVWRSVRGCGAAEARRPLGGVVHAGRRTASALDAHAACLRGPLRASVCVAHARTGKLADAESMVALKDLANRLGSGNTWHEGGFPEMSGAWCWCGGGGDDGGGVMVVVVVVVV
jgi:hypothetical protein